MQKSSALTSPSGQLVMVDIPGTRLDADTAAFLRAGNFGGVCLFRRNITDAAQVLALTTDIRAALGDDGLIAIDQEGGAVARIAFLPQAPSAMALGALDDVDAARAVGAAVGRGLRSLGINWDFAPVVDVNNNPDNPVIAERSFGAAPERVTRLAAAWMDGAQASGLACCLKHFPGHGDTHADSHHALPVVRKAMADLHHTELKPYRALAAHAPGVMTAHILYPEVDAALPATLSPRWLRDELRGTLGFDGVVITDALNMRAVADGWGVPRAAVLALQAGADMVMVLGERELQLQALRAIGQARDAGVLAEADLRRSQQRIMALARRFPAVPQPYPAAQREGDDALMRKLWQQALRSVGAPRAPRRDEPLHIVTQADGGRDAVSDAGVSATRLRALFADFTDIHWELVDDLTQWQPGPARTATRRTVLLSNHRRRYKNSLQGAPDLHVLLWNPYQLLDFPDTPSLMTWGHTEGALEAVQLWLRGEASAAPLSADLLGLPAR